MTSPENTDQTPGPNLGFTLPTAQPIAKKRLYLAGLVADRNLLRPRGDSQREARGRAELVPQRRPDYPVGDHVTERIDSLLGGVEACKPESPRLGDVNTANGGRLGGHPFPASEALEDAAAGVAERCGALIEARLSPSSEGHALDQH